MFKLFRKKADMPVDSLANCGNNAKDSLLPEEDMPKKPEIPEDIKEKVMKDMPAQSQGKRIHNLIILDESGSMGAIYEPALTGVNETLQTIRMAQEENKGQKHFVSLITFDTGHYNDIYSNTPAEKAVDITNSQYRPCGGTPLYDAMGRAINELIPNVAKEDVVLVTVITDGYENASREYDGKAIKSLVERLKSQGWVFTYIGANQDVEAVAASLSINNHLAFTADKTGATDMFEKECRSRKRFFANVDKCGAISDDYFIDDSNSEDFE